MILKKSDDYWMQHALKLAEQAAIKQEVPVGAVLVLDDQIIGEGANSPISLQDPTAHAEILAIRNAAKIQQNYRLLNTTLYVTLEPCVMCAGALIHARIKRLVFGATDTKFGAIGSVLNLFNNNKWTHLVEYQSGILQQPCIDILQKFFKERR